MGKSSGQNNNQEGCCLAQAPGQLPVLLTLPFELLPRHAQAARVDRPPVGGKLAEVKVRSYHNRAILLPARPRATVSP